MDKERQRRLAEIKVPLANVIVLSRLNSQHKFSYDEKIALLVRRELKGLKWDEDEVYPAMVISGDLIGQMVTIKFESKDKMFIFVENGTFKYTGEKGAVEYYQNLVLDTSKVNKTNYSVADVVEEIEDLNKRLRAQSYEKWLNQERRKREEIEAERRINAIFDEIKEIVEE